MKGKTLLYWGYEKLEETNFSKKMKRKSYPNDRKLSRRTKNQPRSHFLEVPYNLQKSDKKGEFRGLRERNSCF